MSFLLGLLTNPLSKLCKRLRIWDFITAKFSKGFPYVRPHSDETMRAPTLSLKQGQARESPWEKGPETPYSSRIENYKRWQQGKLKWCANTENISPNVGIIKKGVILSKKDKVKGHFKRKVIITGLAVFTALFLF